MNRWIENIAMMIGRRPTRPKPEEQTPAMRELMVFERQPEQVQRRKAFIKEEAAHPKLSHKWRNRRWISIIVINLVFLLSYKLDIQVVEGALTASRVFGFHFADLNSSLQVMLAYKEVLINLLIGTGTVFTVYLLFGGRSFCSWACPYHLVSELAEKLHLRLARARLVKDHPLHRGTRTVLYGVFALLAFVTGYTVFEVINPVGILSRALIYGTASGLLWVAGLLLVEIFWSRRFWCRYVCPIGLTYGMAGTIAPVRIRYNSSRCLHEGKCRTVCLVPHVLDMTKMGYSKDVVNMVGPDCTRCAMCLDACPTGALTFDIIGVSDPVQPQRKRSRAP
ncbi:MAG: NapH/MauN family ferredoxin-type protein [Xanthobacteraceae bacterium]|nr:MAG: NapH/MauN family ferredoxin-type protein [Xanthobacteraceae bacterium]